MGVEASPSLTRQRIEIVRPSQDPQRDVRWLFAQRDRFLSGSELAPGVRPMVQRSWARSVMSGVAPEVVRVEHIVQPQLSPRVLRCTEPILRDLELMVQEMSALVLLTDGNGTVVEARGDPAIRRRCTEAFEIPGGGLSEELGGTSGIGTAIEEGRGIQMWAGEHFIDAFHGFFCTALPIRDPLNRQIVAVLNMCIRASDVSQAVPSAMAQITLGAALEIERGLAAQLAVREQALLYRYLETRRTRAGKALIAFDGRTTIASDGALRLLERGDYAALTAYAEESVRGERPLQRQVTLDSGSTMLVVATPQYDGGECIGAILDLRPAARPIEMPAIARAAPAFPALIGQNQQLRRTLEIAASTIAHERGIAIVGEAGTGKYALALAIADAIGGTTTTIECRVLDTHTRQGRSRLAQQIQGARVIVVRHADAIRPGQQRVLSRLFEEYQVTSKAHLIFTTEGTIPASDAARHPLLRLATTHLELQPLRERREDIPLLAQHFLDRIDRQKRIRLSAPLLQALVQADWPGNVRQLESTLRGGAALTRTTEIGLRDVADDLLPSCRRQPLTRLEQAEFRQLRDAMRDAKGNRTRAATALQIARSTLYLKLDRYRVKGFTVLA